MCMCGSNRLILRNEHLLELGKTCFIWMDRRAVIGPSANPWKTVEQRYHCLLTGSMKCVQWYRPATNGITIQTNSEQHRLWHRHIWQNVAHISLARGYFYPSLSVWQRFDKTDEKRQFPLDVSNPKITFVENFRAIDSSWVFWRTSSWMPSNGTMPKSNTSNGWHWEMNTGNRFRIRPNMQRATEATW